MNDLVRQQYLFTNTTNVYCNAYGMCYSYKTENVYGYLSNFYQIVEIDSVTYLTVMNSFSDGWKSSDIVLWKGYDSYTVLDVLPQVNS